jgi:hypothetical protein
MTEGVAAKKTGDNWTHSDLTRQETGEYCGKVNHTQKAPGSGLPEGPPRQWWDAAMQKHFSNQRLLTDQNSRCFCFKDGIPQQQLENGHQAKEV